MMEVQFFRGLRSLYNAKAHSNGIYFATDTKEILHNGLSYLGNLPQDLAEVIRQAEANRVAIEVLNSDGEGSVKKQINDAINEFASRITDDKVVNTFKELVDYAAENAGNFGELIVRVDKIESKNLEQDEAIANLSNELNVTKDDILMKMEREHAELEN